MLNTNMSRVAGYILTGGASSRMGVDKAALTLGGKSFVERAASALESISQNLYLVGGNPENNQRLPVVPDVYQIGQGERRASILGLYSALAHADLDWAAVLACDLPFVSDQLLMRLAELGGIHEKSVFDAVVPIQSDGRLQPLCAFYKPTVLLPHVEGMLAAGNLRLQEILTKVKTCFIEYIEIADLPNAENLFFNVNTPEDLSRAGEIEDKHTHL